MATAAKLIYPHIAKDPQVCGGRACVAGTRIRVLDIVGARQMGMKPEEILEEYPSLGSVYDVYAALVYGSDHKREIEAAFQEDDAIAALIQHDRAEYLKRHPAR